MSPPSVGHYRLFRAKPSGWGGRPSNSPATEVKNGNPRPSRMKPSNLSRQELESIFTEVNNSGTQKSRPVDL